MLRSEELRHPVLTKPKRTQVRAACVACQRGKVKCEGTRPSCTRCTSKALACKYDLEPGVSRPESMRRKNDALQAEVDRLRELLTHDRSTTKTKCLENDQQLLQPAHMEDFATIAEDDGSSSQPYVTDVRGETLASGLENLDVAAMSGSNFQVHARPWTTLAGDGLVSALLSSFFTSDGCFYLSFVDQQYFLDDMNAGDVDMAIFCSPLLVNAICALRCSTSHHARAFGSLQGVDTTDHFLTEARHLLNRECGRASLPTVQSLLVMYTCYVAQGKDRGGLQYRYMAYEMLGRLQVKLEASFHDPKMVNSTANVKYQRALSKTLWGIYCFESVTALSYLQPSMVRAPTIPRLFMSGHSIDPEIMDCNTPEEELRSSGNILNAMCDLSDWLYPAMTGHINNDPGTRAKLLQQMRYWRGNMSFLPNAQASGAPEICCLSQYGDLVALRLLLPLDQDLLMDEPGTTDASCLQHCEQILESCELYWELCASGNRSIMCIYPLYQTAAIALTQMEEHQHKAYNLFERGCSLMDERVEEYPIALYLLRALEVIAGDVRLPLSDRLLRIFKRSSLTAYNTTDVPVAFVLPIPLEMVQPIPIEEGLGTSKMGIKVEDLVSRQYYRMVRI